MTKYRIYKHESDGRFHIYKKVLFWWIHQINFISLKSCQEILAEIQMIKKRGNKKELIEEIEIE